MKWIQSKSAEPLPTAAIEIAEKCGLNALTVARLIKGNTARTSIKIVGKLARVLGVDSESLILKG